MSGTELLGDPQYIRQFGESPSVVVTIALLVGLALVGTSLVRRPRPVLALTGVWLAVVVGVTAVPSGGWRNFGLTAGIADSIRRNVRPERADLTAWLHAGDGPLNVVLFVPLGLLLALLLRRPVTAVLACVALSVLIECYQSSLTTRVGSFADVVANGVGAVAGALVAAVVLLATRPGPGERSGSRLPAGAAR